MANELDKLPRELRYAFDDIAGEAKCRCSEAYTSRGMQDPQCNHDLAESVGIIRAELLRLTDERDELRASLETETDVSISLNNEMYQVVARAEKAEAELAALRETVTRLNRRVQTAEAAVAEKAKAHDGPSLGRALANAAASQASAELAALQRDIECYKRVEQEIRKRLQSFNDPDARLEACVQAALQAYGEAQEESNDARANLGALRKRLVVED